MRWKIIIVNAGIVAIVAVLSFVLLSTSLSGTLQDPVARKADVERAIRSANAQLELDGLRMERWLAEQANTEDLRVIFSVGTTDARAESATKQANKIHDAAKAEPGFQQMAPSLVLLVNEAGVGLGRNGTNLMRGDDMGAIYPSLKESLKTGRTMSDVWLNKGRGEQMLASYAPVRGEDDEIVGAIVVGTPLNDERLTNTSRLTSGVALVMGVKAEGAFEVIARSDQVGAAQSALQAQPVVAAAEGTLTSGNMAVVSGASDQYLAGAAPLSGYGGGSHAALIAAVPSSLVPSIGGLLWPVFAVAGLGILMVLAGGFVLGNYISQPVEEMEEGLLQIINGQTDLRFQIEHPDLGGLITRINSLLNALMGVPETDEDGRTSTAPGQPFQGG